MTSLASGDFTLFRRSDSDDSPEEIGLVLRTSSNEKGDGSKDEYAEVVPLPEKYLVPVGNCRKFGEEPEPDGSEVVGSTSEEVAGVKKPAPTQHAKGATK